MDAVQSLVMQHQDYVRALARGIAEKLPGSVEFEELVGFGQVGLAEAARNFRPGAGAQFATFAYYRIRGAIFDGLRKIAGLRPAMRTRVTRMEGEDQVVEGMALTGGMTEDSETLASQFSEAVARLGTVYLLASAGEAGEIEPAGERSAADDVQDAELAGMVKGAVEKLQPRQAQVIRMLYFQRQSQTECARAMGVDKSTICRIHRDAIAALRDSLGG